MSAIAAWRDGINDARTGRTPFFAGALADPAQSTVRLNEALVATSRIILLGLVMDGIYQAIEFKTFHPAEAVIIALVLAFLPYLLLRGLIARASGSSCSSVLVARCSSASSCSRPGRQSPRGAMESTTPALGARPFSRARSPTRHSGSKSG
jgi:hypothetical protein